MFRRHLFRPLFCAALVAALAGCRAGGDPALPTQPPPPIRTASAGPTPTRAEADIWAELAARPLRLPTLAPGAACPATPGRAVHSSFAPAQGDGPLYSTGAGPAGMKPYYPNTFDAARGVYWMKTLWAAAPGYEGVSFIRGRQIDGLGDVLFSSHTPRGEEVVGQELRFGRQGNVIGAPGPGNWRFQSSMVGVAAPGCYAFQIDGEGFGAIIVFEAAPAAP